MAASVAASLGVSTGALSLRAQNKCAELVEVAPSGLRFFDFLGAASFCCGGAGGTYDLFRWYLHVWARDQSLWEPWDRAERPAGAV